MRLARAWLKSIGAPLLLIAGIAASVGAQAISQGFDLERQGRVDQAAGLYTSVLRSDPANLPALLGLERVLPGLGRLPELLPLVQRALAADSSAAIRGLAVRTFVVLDEVDSAAALGRRWAAQRPRDPAPWREWAIALEDQQRFDAAYNVLIEGRRTIGTPGALAIELAELGQRTGNWQAAALEWAAAVSAVPSQLPTAAGQLEDAPLDQHDRVIHALTVPDASTLARRLAAELLLGWGQPERAWDIFAATLEPPGPETVFALRRFADRAGGTAPGVRRARGLALAHLADLVPAQLASRARAEAARALLDAGDRVAARSMLAKLADDSTAPADAQALARSALVEALIADGQLDSATAALAGLDQERRANGEDRERLRHALVGAWIATGRLDRAEQALGADSSVAALALRGWVELYRGDLQSAVESFRRAGPYAGDRDAATARTTVLALLEQIDAKRSPELGVALLTLARGDSSGAVSGLRRAASRLPSARGRPDVLLRAAQIAVGQGAAQEDLAADLLAEVVRTGGRGAAAPAAELEWARLLLRQGRPADAVSHLEHLILTYPGSAVVPEARRELERAKGAIPRS